MVHCVVHVCLLFPAPPRTTIRKGALSPIFSASTVSVFLYSHLWILSKRGQSIKSYVEESCKKGKKVEKLYQSDQRFVKGTRFWRCPHLCVVQWHAVHVTDISGHETIVRVTGGMRRSNRSWWSIRQCGRTCRERCRQVQETSHCSTHQVRATGGNRPRLLAQMRNLPFVHLLATSMSGRIGIIVCYIYYIII
jgi:hypothetical protein